MNRTNQELRITAQTEKVNLRNNIESLRNSFQMLDPAKLMSTIDGLTAENDRMAKLIEDIQLRYFLLSVELQRRDNIYLAAESNISAMKKKFELMDTKHTQLLEETRMQTEQMVRERLSKELYQLERKHESEVTRIEKMLKESGADLAQRDSLIVSLREKIKNLEGERTQFNIQLSDISNELDITKRKAATALEQERNQSKLELQKVHSAHLSDIDSLKERLEKSKNSEIEQITSGMRNQFNAQIEDKDNLIGGLRREVGHSKEEISELQRENSSLNNAVIHLEDNISALRIEMDKLKSESNKELSILEDNHKRTLQRELDILKKQHESLTNTLTGDLQKKLDAQKKKVLELEQNLMYTSKERDRFERQLDDITVDRDEWKSKFDDLNKQNATYIEELTIERNNIFNSQAEEIDRLKMEINALNEANDAERQSLLSNLRRLENENNNLRADIHNITDLSNQRKAEIEDWKRKHTGFITGDEADRLQNETKALRQRLMELEDNEISKDNDNKRLSDRIHSLQNDLISKSAQVEKTQSLNNQRREELVRVQEENSKLTKLLQTAMAEKTEFEGHNQMNFEELSDLRSKIERLTKERDSYKMQAQESDAIMRNKVASLMTQIEDLRNYKPKDEYSQIGSERITITTQNMGYSHYINPEERENQYG